MDSEQADNDNQSTNNTVKELHVRILNKSLHVGERIRRLGTDEGTALLRDAKVRVSENLIELGCFDDYGEYEKLARLPFESIKHARIKKNAITPFQQLTKPALSGVLSGIVLLAVLYFQMKDKIVSLSKFIGDFIGLLFFVTFLFVLFSLRNLTWSKLDIIIFENRNNLILDFAVKGNQVESIIELMKERGIPVEFI